jgi:hypothetical protein
MPEERRSTNKVDRIAMVGIGVNGREMGNSVW